jgi:SWI/SNF-related matrix-associated actin-dependent regulator 1 of chromatin subfamily A
VDAALAAQAAALEQTRALAAQQGSSTEALRADNAARWIAVAREALARGDLFQAREALAQAQVSAAGARALSNQEAGTASGR